MGELHATMNVTLDGSYDHRHMIADHELHEWAAGLLEGAAAVLFGRVTYELMRGHWPAVAASGSGAPAEVRFARVLESKPKYLVSRREPAPGWNTSRVKIAEDGGDIRTLKRDLGGTLTLGASPSLARALMAARRRRSC